MNLADSSNPSPTPNRDPSARLPDWRLPQGVSRSLWDYSQSSCVAEDYDQQFASEPLFEFDQAQVDDYFREPGTLYDLGCGAGRLSLRFAAKPGFRVVAVDLSPHMLEVVGDKARAAGLSVDRLRANLVDLQCVADGSADYAACLFSTLGMIRGRENRQRALGHVARILRPSGRFALHVHNVYFLAQNARGWLDLAANAVRSVRGREEFGDTTASNYGIPQFFLHFFTSRELLHDLTGAGLRVETWLPLAPGGRGILSGISGVVNFRCVGWLVLGTKAQGRDRDARSM